MPTVPVAAPAATAPARPSSPTTNPGEYNAFMKDDDALDAIARGDGEDAPEEDQGGARADTPDAPDNVADEDQDDGDRSADADTEDAEDAADRPETAPPADAKKLATEFKVYDGKGEEYEIPDIVVGVTYKGEERKMPLDRVVRLAQSGFYNEQLQSEVAQAREQLPEATTRAKTYADALVRQNAILESILTDPAEYDRAVERYQQANSPDARAARLADENRQLREGKQHEERTAYAESFVTGVVRPALDSLITQYPNISREAIVGRFNMETARFGAVIPPDAFPQVQHILANDLPAWAASLHEESLVSSRTKETEKDRQNAEQLRRAKEDTFRAKKIANRVMKPVGRVGPASKPARGPLPTGLDNRVESILDSAGL